MLLFNLQSVEFRAPFEAAAAARRKACAVGAAWRLNNPDRVKKNSVAYYAANREKISEKRRVAKENESSTTREQRLEYFKLRYASDKKSMLKQFHDRYISKRDAVLIASHERYLKLRDEILARARSPEFRQKDNATRKIWRQKYPEKVAVANATRHRRARSAAGTLTAEQLKARFDFYGNRCAYCSGPAEAADHVIPLSRGGSNWPANIRPACVPCNSSKRNKKLSEWQGRSGLQRAA